MSVHLPMVYATQDYKRGTAATYDATVQFWQMCAIFQLCWKFRGVYWQFENTEKFYLNMELPLGDRDLITELSFWSLLCPLTPLPSASMFSADVSQTRLLNSWDFSSRSSKGQKYKIHQYMLLAKHHKTGWKTFRIQESKSLQPTQEFLSHREPVGESLNIRAGRSLQMTAVTL